MRRVPTAGFALGLWVLAGACGVDREAQTVGIGGARPTGSTDDAGRRADGETGLSQVAAPQGTPASAAPAVRDAGSRDDPSTCWAKRSATPEAPASEYVCTRSGGADATFQCTCAGETSAVPVTHCGAALRQACNLGPQQRTERRDHPEEPGVESCKREGVEATAICRLIEANYLCSCMPPGGDPHLIADFGTDAGTPPRDCVELLEEACPQAFE